MSNGNYTLILYWFFGVKGGMDRSMRSRKEMQLLINKVVPKPEALFLRRQTTRREEKHTEKGGEVSPRVEDHNVLRCRKARTRGLPKASYSWERRAPLTRNPISGRDMIFRSGRRTPFWHLDEEQLFAFFRFRDMGWDERILGKCQWVEPK